MRSASPRHLAAVGADASDVIVDMARVDFIDLSGLDAVLRAHRLFEILGLSFTSDSFTPRNRKHARLVATFGDLIGV